MTLRPLATTFAATALLAGCGVPPGGGEQARTQTPQVAPAPRTPLELPAGIPLKATGPADPAGARVVRAWSKALRAGDVAAATALWAVPSKVQNGTPVLTLSSRDYVRIFNASLPCGSVVTSTGAAAGGFTITTFRLTRRKGARCDAAAGATARSAVRVRDGKIVEWYRLPDDPDSPDPRTDDIDSTTI
jgi:limonene-1,2-epoxide hydrolase